MPISIFMHRCLNTFCDLGAKRAMTARIHETNKVLVIGSRARNEHRISFQLTPVGVERGN